ncbi:hypothetical protein AYO44_07680 [Planctomycetaceae bacterium SCGC AG-212-F19]|nr:hypothetical protein AYO44_07680 [Planctomycetaceae bacterium SCGC AG-212-F19]
MGHPHDQFLGLVGVVQFDAVDRLALLAGRRADTHDHPLVELHRRCQVVLRGVLLPQGGPFLGGTGDEYLFPFESRLLGLPFLFETRERRQPVGVSPCYLDHEQGNEAGEDTEGSGPLPHGFLRKRAARGQQDATL